MSPDKQKYPLELKVKTVENYLASKLSVRKIANNTGIPYQTIWDWIRQYKKGGPEGLKEERLMRKRISQELETTIMRMKERYPSLSINGARQLLKKEKISISHKGIWQIWKKYGLSKRPSDEPLTPFCTPTPESANGLRRARDYVHEKQYKEAAQVLNELPCLSEDPIVLQVPEDLLSPRRQLDRIYLEFAHIPFHELRQKARRLGHKLEKEGFMYSSILVNFQELMALGWMARFEEQIPILHHLVKKMKNFRNKGLWYHFYHHQATAYMKSMQTVKALACIDKCRGIVSALGSLHYQNEFANLLTFAGRYRESTLLNRKVLKHEHNPRRKADLCLRIANLGHNAAGEYRDAKRMIAKSQTIKNLVVYPSLYNLGYAQMSYGQGNLTEALNFFLEALKKASKAELYNIIYTTSSGLGSVAMALNKKTDAHNYLKKYLPLLENRRLLQEVTILKLLQGKGRLTAGATHCLPTMRVLNLIVNASRTLKKGDYRKALRFAQEQRLLGLFHRWIVFFPTPVLRMLEKGKPTGLPRAILKFPVFNQTTPVYHMKFLGDITITKGMNYVRVNLSPQEQAFVIHFALRAGAPGKSIVLPDIYRNFWNHSTKPANRLLHLLASIKREIKLPSHLLTVSSVSGVSKLINRGFYVTTDSDEFETLLTQIKSLERTGEWSFARRDYLRAFKLLRGEPFRKMYDPWSEQMRAVILNKVNDMLLNFVRGCVEHNNIKEGRQIAERISAFIPVSEEVQKLITGRSP